MTRFSDERMRAFRNKIPIEDVICRLGLPAKEVEGHFRFLCPVCNEFNTATNPNTNLGRCFRCQENYNPIDLVITVRKMSFLQAVQFLTRNFGKLLSD